MWEMTKRTNGGAVFVGIGVGCIYGMPMHGEGKFYTLAWEAYVRDVHVYL